MSYKILLLEDDPKLANEINQYFTLKGYQCDVAYDGLVLLKQRKLYMTYIFLI